MIEANIEFLAQESNAIDNYVTNNNLNVIKTGTGLRYQIFSPGDGDFVKKGQLLFQIEPDEYNIAVRAAEASVQQQEAIYKNSIQELERAKELIAENFISRSDYDGIVATANMHKASIDEVKQSLARAKLDLKYTKKNFPRAVIFKTELNPS